MLPVSWDDGPEMTTANLNLEMALMDHDISDCSHPELSIKEDASNTTEVENFTGTTT